MSLLLLGGLGLLIASLSSTSKKPSRPALPDVLPGSDPNAWGPDDDDDDSDSDSDSDDARSAAEIAQQIVDESSEIIDGQRDAYSDDDDDPLLIANAAVEAATRDAPSETVVVVPPAPKPVATTTPKPAAKPKPAKPAPKVAPAAQVPAPKPVAAKPVAAKPVAKAPTPSPSAAPLPSGSDASTVPVLGAQKALNALGYGLIEDGLYGPLTQKGWADAAKRFPPSKRNANFEPVFARVGPKEALTYRPTAEAIAEAAASAVPKPTSPAVLPSGANASTVPVLGSQQALNRLGYKLTPDGLWGPVTQAAWADASRRFPPPANLRNAAHEPTFARVSATQALTYKPTAEAIAKAALAAPTPKPAAASSTSPKPNPEGYDPAKARASARSVANNISRSKNQASIDTRLLQQWQRQAGITPDGKYGGGTRGALLYFGVPIAQLPQPYVAPLATTTYVPPEKR